MPSFQSTPPHAGSDDDGAHAHAGVEVSIHAPHAGSDWSCAASSWRGTSFNPRPPRGERRRRHRTGGTRIQFQSPPPTRGATITAHVSAVVQSCFNPRPPRGERPSPMPWSIRRGSFNPRPPRGERPEPPLYGARRDAVSIHAPHAGSDGGWLRTRLAAGRPRTAATRLSFSKSPTSRGALRTKARVKPAPVTYSRRTSDEVTRRLEGEAGR